MKVAVLGGGPAGLSAARYLAVDPDVSVTVLERSGRFGGLLRSDEREGRVFDVGTILFNAGHGLVDAFPDLADELVPIRYAPRSLNPSGDVDLYPFSLRGYVRSNGAGALLRSGFETARAKLRYRSKDSVGAYARYYMGESFYERSGLRHYIERLHELPDTGLDVEFAHRRLAMLQRQSFRAIAGRSVGIGRHRHRGGGVRVRSPDGFEAMFARIGTDLEAAGVRLCNGVDLRSIEPDGTGFVVHEAAGAERFDEIVSTVPLPTLCALFGIESASESRTKALLSLYLVGKVKVPGNTFFNFTHESRWKRVTVFSRFYGDHADPAEPDWFTVEITGDAFDAAAAGAHGQVFVEHATRHGLIAPGARVVGWRSSPDAYPLYTRSVVPAVERDRAAVERLGVHLLGRQGNFEYVISNVVARKAVAVAGRVRAGSAPVRSPHAS